VSQATSELAHLFRALKAPAAARALPKLADRARAEEWSYEQFAAVLLKTEIDSRDSHGGQARIKAARFPARKILEEFDLSFQRSIKKQNVLHLGQLDFLHGRENVVLLGPPGTCKTHLAIALGIRACLAGHRVLFKTATEWVASLSDAQRQGRLDDELDRLQRIPLLVVDEVGYIPFDPQAANLMFMLVSRRYERASLVVTSNKPFSAWGEIFGDEVTATAMIDRLVHHAEILSLKGRQLPPQGPRAYATAARTGVRLSARGRCSGSPSGLASATAAAAATGAFSTGAKPAGMAEFSTGASGPVSDRP
jgi:DNA replication protein DnaC